MLEFPQRKENCLKKKTKKQKNKKTKKPKKKETKKVNGSF